MRNVVAASKWKTSFGSWRINSMNFVWKCNFSKFYYFWVLGPLLYKIWLQNTPPIVGDGVYICIESLKYYDKIYDILFWKKKNTHLLFLNFPHNLLQYSAMVLFKGLKIPKIIGWMDWLATLKVWCNLNPTSICDAHDFYFFGDIHNNVQIRNKVKCLD